MLDAELQNEFMLYHDIMNSINGKRIQRGMNYKVDNKFSIFLMNSSPIAPYIDKYDGGILIYEGHDVSKQNKSDPKKVDQPERNKDGTFTINGKFFDIANKYKNGLIEEAELIKVYEKIKKNKWIDRGFFRLVDAKRVKLNDRFIFNFILIPEDISRISEKEIDCAIHDNYEYIVKEILASESKRIVNTRNGQNIIRKYCLSNYDNKCALCDIDDSDLLITSHIIPWSKDKTKRGLLDNVICLCVLHDKLFEQRKLIISEDYSVSFSQDYLTKCDESETYSHIKEFTKNFLRLPNSSPPNKDLLLMRKRP